MTPQYNEHSYQPDLAFKLVFPPKRGCLEKRSEVEDELEILC